MKKKKRRKEVGVRILGRGACGGSVVSGCGVVGGPIDPADLPHIFDRFYRADPSRQNHGGYGLGLAIARTIVLGHKGKIRAENREGAVAFVVRLPRDKD